MRRRPLLATLGTLSAGLSGCIGVNSDPSTQTTPATWLNVPAPETRPEGSTTADRTAVVRGNAGFALDLVGELVREDPSTNTMISPVSLGTAMGMVWAGAAGQTATEIREVIRYLDEQEATHEAFGALLYDLANMDLDEIEGSFELSIANAFWGDEGTEFDEAYLDVLDTAYGSGFYQVDFKKTAAARERINAWAAEQTNDRIDDLLPAGSIQQWTHAVLTNTVYLLADWKHPFDPERTRESAFTNLDGSTSTTNMMSQQGHFRLIHGEPAMLDGDDQPSETTDEDGPGMKRDERYALLELPYVAESIDMVLILPPAGRFEAFEAAITGEWLLDRFDELGATSPSEVAVTLPRFTFENELTLEEPLKQLGMVTPFHRENADLSNMTPGPGGGFFIHQVYHDTFVSVDELGTEAAAATAVGVGDGSTPPSITFDRPFLFAIRDRETQAILYYGRVVDGSSLEGGDATE